MTEFECSVQRDLHNEEIAQSRIGGIGGSDAAMVLRIAERGIEGITATDLRRVSVMAGVIKPSNFGGNDHTTAGHDFEDWVENCGLLRIENGDLRREYCMEKGLAAAFKTFAHADFVTGQDDALDVIECKFVQKKGTDAVMRDYYAQLQWYYLLGARRVYLLHGVGAVPFDAETVSTTQVYVERDNYTIEMLRKGVMLLDNALTNGWKPVPPETCTVEDASNTVRKAFERLCEIKQQRNMLDEEEEQIRAMIMSYLEDMSYTQITDGVYSAIYTKESESRTFDKSKLFKLHPEFDKDEFYKVSKRKATIMLRETKITK